ncbi:MAG: MBL fold metallo-hydrolase [Piscirickettsiaceae bacterium]|nr:MAG: MBL fold metallo-hydrolase [Piscirickettsiaceae bacterium]
MNNLIYEDIGHGVSCVDSQYIRPGLASCYLIEQNGHAAFIDVGTNYTVPLLIELLAEKNIPLENVDFVIPTHVHLDHAGGAGSMMQHATNAQLIIHPRGARHMIDPSRLQAGASAVYGEDEFKKHYGDLIAIDENRVTVADDGFSINFQSRVLDFIDTPGHAKHHFCIIDKTSNGIFTGDTFGVAYPELTVNEQPFIFPPSSPVDFNPEDWLNSIDKIMATGCDRAYLTHFNKVDKLQPLSTALRERVGLFAQFAIQSPNSDALKTHVQAYFVEEILKTGCQLTPDEIISVLSLDIDLITQGLMVWVEKNA